MFYRNKNVVVIGGGDSACGEALFLSRICAGVKIIHRRDSFRASQIMSERVLADKKIVPVWNSIVEEFVAGENGRCSAVLVKNLKTGATEKIPCDGAFVAIGHKPNTEIFAGQIGLDPDGYVALQSGSAVRTSVAGVYAAGDCASVWSKLLDKPMYIALGTNANKQGRLAGDAVLGKNVRFARALGTSMLRVMGMEFAKTGLGEQECKANGIDYKTTTVESRSHARYYPDPVTLTVKLTYRAADKVLLGAQIAGAKEAAVRIDTFACAVDKGMTTDELGFLDLGYAPPFASVWDAIAIAANASK